MNWVEAVIFDWAGTVVDFGSVAPLRAFVESFAQSGLNITTEDARAPMGMAKRDHIAAILAMPHVRDDFIRRNGRMPCESDIDRIYEVFLPVNEEIAGDHAELVPGTAETTAKLRDRGIRIGSTTGYTRSIMNRIVPVAAEQGFVPDCLVCSDEVENGRPAPDAMQVCFEILGVTSPSRVVKVDDTEPGIGEGVSAGSIAIGVCLSGNHCGLSVAQLAAMDTASVKAIRQEAAKRLRAAGAHYVIDTVRDLPDLLFGIEKQPELND